MAFAAAVGFAVIDELYQGFVPGRQSSLADVGYDALGAVLALLALRVRAKLQKIVPDYEPHGIGGQGDKETTGQVRNGFNAEV